MDVAFNAEERRQFVVPMDLSIVMEIIINAQRHHKIQTAPLIQWIVIVMERATKQTLYKIAVHVEMHVLWQVQSAAQHWKEIPFAQLNKNATVFFSMVLYYQVHSRKRNKETHAFLFLAHVSFFKKKKKKKMSHPLREKDWEITRKCFKCELPSIRICTECLHCWCKTCYIPNKQENDLAPTFECGCPYPIGRCEWCFTRDSGYLCDDLTSILAVDRINYLLENTNHNEKEKAEYDGWIKDLRESVNDETEEMTPKQKKRFLAENPSEEYFEKRGCITIGELHYFTRDSLPLVEWGKNCHACMFKFFAKLWAENSGIDIHTGRKI